MTRIHVLDPCPACNGSGSMLTDTVAASPRPREYGLAMLRTVEAKSLASLVSEAISQAHSVAHEMHIRIYDSQPVQHNRLGGLLSEARVCCQVAEHYLRLLGGVLASDDPQADQAPF